MPSSKLRDDIVALELQPADHQGTCIMHCRAFRTQFSPQQCVDFYHNHEDAFQAAARAKVLRASVVSNGNFHITSRDVLRRLENLVASTVIPG